MTCEEGPETVFSMFYPTYLLSFIIFTSKSGGVSTARLSNGSVTATPANKIERVGGSPDAVQMHSPFAEELFRNRVC